MSEINLNKKKEFPIWLAIVIIIIWLISTIYAFWWFQYKDMRGFANVNWEERFVKFKGQPLQKNLSKDIESLLSNHKITVVNFINPSCGCNKFNYEHLNELKKSFNKDVQFISLVKNEVDGTLNQTQNLNILQAKYVSSDLIPASPAAAIFDKTGKMIYFGPFSDGAFCGQGNNLVEGKLTKLTNNQNVEPWINMRGYGCFCDW